MRDGGAGCGGRTQEAAALGVDDDGGGGAVFDGAAGVGPLGFAEDLDAGAAGASGR